MLDMCVCVYTYIYIYICIFHSLFNLTFPLLALSLPCAPCPLVTCRSPVLASAVSARWARPAGWGCSRCRARCARRERRAQRAQREAERAPCCAPQWGVRRRLCPVMRKAGVRNEMWIVDLMTRVWGWRPACFQSKPRMVSMLTPARTTRIEAWKEPQAPILTL